MRFIKNCYNSYINIDHIKYFFIGHHEASNTYYIRSKLSNDDENIIEFKFDSKEKAQDRLDYIINLIETKQRLL